MAKQPRTSYEKSHSKFSNAKLTILCLFSSLMISACIGSLGIYLYNKTSMYMFCAIITFALSILSFWLFSRFKR